MARNIQLDQLFVERIPVAVSQRRSLYAAGLAGVGIDEAAHEAELFDASLQLRDAVAGADAGALGQSADAAEHVRVQLSLTPDDVVGLFHEPVHQPGMLAVHHLVRTGRDELHVGAHLRELGEMRGASEDRLIQGVRDVVVGGAGAAAAVRPPVGDESGLVDVELVRRGHVSVGVDDHICFFLLSRIDDAFAQAGLYRLRDGKRKGYPPSRCRSANPGLTAILFTSCFERLRFLPPVSFDQG